jgi:hypothetical protein
VTFRAGDRVFHTVTLSNQEWVTVRQNVPSESPAARWVELRVDPPWSPRGEARALGVQTRDVGWVR